MPSALTDADLERLDELLAGAPAPLQPLDVVALDGFLCGVLVQPQRIGLAQWLPAALDIEKGIVPEDVDTPWLAEVTRLVERHHDALRTQLAEGSFDPLLPAEAVDAPDEDPDLPTPSRVLSRWVAGFAHAAEQFPALAELPDDRVADALDRIWRIRARRARRVESRAACCDARGSDRRPGCRRGRDFGADRGCTLPGGAAPARHAEGGAQRPLPVR